MLIDSREPKKFIEYFERQGFKVTKLDIGDYQVGEYIIERKRISEFMQSIYSGRAFEQLYKLNSVHGILLLHNIWERYDENQFHKILASIIKSFPNINIIIVKDELAVKEFISYLAKILNKPKGEKPVKFKKKIYIEDTLEDMFTAVKGVGRKTAKYIVTSGYSLKELANMNLTELQNLFGKKLGARLFYIFNWKKELGKQEVS